MMHLGELARYRFIYEVQEPLLLQGYVGSKWRGALGHALKEVACNHPVGAEKAVCGECSELVHCIYPPCFEALPARGAVRPFIIEPQAYTGYFCSGAIIGVDLVLLGWANSWLPVICDAFDRLGQHGLGERNVPLALVGVLHQDNRTTNGWSPVFASVVVDSVSPVVTPVVLPPAPRQVRVDLVTPLRAKRDGLIGPQEFGWKDLCVLLKRRIMDCGSVCGYACSWNDECFHADGLVRKQLQWVETLHYSSRQQKSLKLGGLIGHLVCQGRALAPIWPWLWLGQWLHLGEGATSGLGRYVLSPMGREALSDA